MNMTPQEYQQYVKQKAPKSPLLKDTVLAFVVGGAICVVGQLILNGWTAAGLEEKTAGTATSCTLVFLSALLTWVRPDPYNPVVRTLNALTEPVLYRIRKWLPFTYISGLDLSPIVVLVAIQLVQAIVVRSLFQYAAML